MAMEMVANMIMMTMFCHFLAAFFLGLDYKFPAENILPQYLYSESTTSSSSQARKENHNILKFAETILVQGPMQQLEEYLSKKNKKIVWNFIETDSAPLYTCHTCLCLCLCLCWAQSTNTHVSVCVYASVVFGRGLKRCLSDTDGSPLASCYIAKYISFHGWCGGESGLGNLFIGRGKTRLS